MELTRAVKRGTTTHSLWIKDGNLEYPIPLKGLHNPIILSALEEEGWELYELPYDIRKGNITLESLPVSRFEDEHYTEEQEQEMMDMTAVIYKDVDLRAKVRKRNVEFYKWAQNFPRINTRQEFINFLNTIGHSSMEIDRLESYMPLNSFVNKNALFTIDEYFSAENIDYRSIIENRRRLSFKNYSRLIKQFSKMGVDELSTPKEIVDKYFSWGICGININATSVRREQVQMRLGSTVSGTEDRYKPYVKLSELSYLKADGSWNYNQNTQTWKPSIQETDMVRIANSLRAEGSNHIYPMMISTRINDEVTSINADGLRVDYNESTLIYHYMGQDIICFTVQIADLADSSKNLKNKNFNIMNSEIKKEIFNDLYTESLCKLAIDKITIKTDASSYKALAASGCSPISAISYIYHTGEYCDTLFSGVEVDKSMVVMVDEMKSFMRDLSISKPELEQNISEFIDDVISGRINIDFTYEGIASDASQSNSLIYNIIRVANRYLGVSYRDIFDMIDNYNLSDGHIDFEGNGMIIRLPMHERKGKLEGYKADLNYYRVKQSKEAVSWMFVTKACTFPGSKYSGKHIAAEVLYFNRTAGKRIENNIDALIYEEIEMNTIMRERNAAYEARPIILSQAIFSLYINGTYKMPEQYGGKNINVDANLLRQLRNVIEIKFDSLLTITDTTTWSGGGEFVRYCVNAVLTPEYIIPRARFVINEVPFMPIWYNHANIKAAPQIRAEWIEKGFCDPSHMGYAGIYERVDLANRGKQLIDIPGYKIENDPVSLLAFYLEADEYRLRGLEVKSHLYTVYPKLAPESWNENVKVTEDGSKYKWCSEVVQPITRESMIERDPEIANLFGFNKLEISDKKQYGKFKEFEARDFLLLEDYDDLKMSHEFGDKIKLVSIFSDKIKFADGFTINYKDIEVVDQNTYAVVQLCGRKYLAEDIVGGLREVNI